MYSSENGLSYTGSNRKDGLVVQSGMNVRFAIERSRVQIPPSPP
jgi:hypothetical protein